MYASGARAQEICDLTVMDVAHDKNGNAILTLLGKGNKPRRVKITADAASLLDKYIAYRKIGNQRLTVMCSQARETSGFPYPALKKSLQNTKNGQGCPS
jgi:site-specific recombinase XerD